MRRATLPPRRCADVQWVGGGARGGSSEHRSCAWVSVAIPHEPVSISGVSGILSDWAAGKGGGRLCWTHKI